jgi:hypothetical protein
MNVRFDGNNGHDAGVTPFPLMTHSGHCRTSGHRTGYQTYAYYLPSEKTTMVVMVNSNADAVAVWNFVRGIVKIITPDHPWPAPPSGE